MQRWEDRYRNFKSHGVNAAGRSIRANQILMSVKTLGDTTYFLGGSCEQDWKFLCLGDSVLSCIGHAKE